MTSAVEKMLAALDCEIEALKKRPRRQPLRAGERTRLAGEEAFYRFIAGPELQFRDDDVLGLEVEGTRYNATVVTSEPESLTVLCEADLGPTIPKAELLTDGSLLTTTLRKRLAQVLNDPEGFHRSSADRVVGEAPVHTVSPPDQEPGEPLPELNAEQRQAVDRGLALDHLLLWGPPGTGKTTTLAALIAAHWVRGRSVLITSNTNLAVDAVLEKVLDRIPSSAIENGEVLRLGPVVAPELALFAPRIELEPRLKARARELTAKLEPLEQQIVALQADHRQLEEAGQLYAAERDLDRQTEEIHQEEAAVFAELGRYQLQRSQAQEALVSFQREGEKWAAFTGFFGLGSTRRQHRLRRQAREQETLLHRSEEHIAEIEGRRVEICQRQLELARRRARLTAELVKTSRPPRPSLGRLLEDVTTQLAQVRDRCRELREALREVRREILAQARIVASTATRASFSQQLTRDFDVVVIDEASMLMLPLTYLIAGLAKRAVVVVGDFLQLPSIVTSTTEDATAWLQRDPFTLQGVPEAIQRGYPPHHLVSLATQHRMVPALGEMVSQLIYRPMGLPLRHGRREEDRDAIFTDAPGALFFVDTSTAGPWTSRGPNGSSRFNPLHALLADALAGRWFEHQGETAVTSPEPALGIVAPFSAQVAFTRQLLQQRLGEGAAQGLVGTVHRFQGKERKTILLDWTEAPGRPVWDVHKATDPTAQGGRLLNVAISRARDHLVVIAHFDYLTAHAPGSLLVRMLEHLKAHGRALPLEKLLPWGKGLAIYNEQSYLEVLAERMRAAREKIVVISPFYTHSGIAKWGELLIEQQRRGVKVRIITRPADAGAATDRKALVKLQHAGIELDEYPALHEKLVTIDGQETWAGSLNLLSHRRTTEILWCKKGAGFAQSMLRCIEAERPARVAALRRSAPAHRRPAQ